MHHSAGYPSIAIGWDAGSSVADCGSLSPQGCQILWESCLFHVTFSLRPSYSSGFQAWPPTNFSIIANFISETHGVVQSIESLVLVISIEGLFVEAKGDLIPDLKLASFGTHGQRNKGLDRFCLKVLHCQF